MNTSTLTRYAGAVLFSLLCFFMFAAPAEAKHNYPDSDRYVPVYWKCEPNGDWWAETRGRVTGDKVERWIRVNYCRLYVAGAGPWDFYNILRHEYAHGKGWEHWEKPAKKNPAYYPVYRLCGC